MPPAEKQFALRILTPMGEAVNTDARAIRVEAWDGQVGVLARHAPMITELEIGSAVITEADGERRWFAMVGGVMRVKEGEVVLMVSAAEEAEEIDVDRARRALQRAEQRLAAREGEVDLSRAELALARAMNRLKVAEHGRA